MKIELGWRVRHIVNGFRGIVVCRAEWLTGCARLTVQPEELKDGKSIEAECFDENTLEVLDQSTSASSIAGTDPMGSLKGPANVGGPQPVQRQQPNQTR